MDLIIETENFKQWLINFGKNNMYFIGNSWDLKKNRQDFEEKPTNLELSVRLHEIGQKKPDC